MTINEPQPQTFDEWWADHREQLLDVVMSMAKCAWVGGELSATEKRLQALKSEQESRNAKQ